MIDNGTRLAAEPTPLPMIRSQAPACRIRLTGAGRTHRHPRLPTQRSRNDQIPQGPRPTRTFPLQRTLGLHGLSSLRKGGDCDAASPFLNITAAGYMNRAVIYAQIKG